jgi:hypothetical protein
VQIELFERRQSCGQRSAGGLRVILHGWWRLYFVWREWPEYFLLEFPWRRAGVRLSWRGVLLACSTGVLCRRALESMF